LFHDHIGTKGRVRGIGVMTSLRMTTDSVVQRNPDIIAAEVGEDLVMVSIEKGFYYGVSDVGREIWGSIEQPKKISQLIEELTATYDVDPELCKQQTMSFLEKLVEENLLKVSNEATD
jgi:hypothetical protein